MNKRSLSFIPALLFSFAFILPGVLAQGNQQNVYYARYPTATVIELKLKDTVSPEFIDYYFYRFGYNIIEHDIRPVEAIIHRYIPEEYIILMTQHPFVEKITKESTISDTEEVSLPVTRIVFSHSATDEMISGFAAIHSGFDIELLPRNEKRVIVKENTWRSDRFAEELKMLIYVEEAIILSPYTP